MSTLKKYLKSKPVCKVTFNLSPEIVNGASSISLVGDFNEWDEKSNEMKSLKNGSFKTTVDLDVDNKYEFRYLIDGQKWINDESADQYIPNIYGEENSVIEL